MLSSQHRYYLYMIATTKILQNSTNLFTSYYLSITNFFYCMLAYYISIPLIAFHIFIINIPFCYSGNSMCYFASHFVKTLIGEVPRVY